MTFVLSVVFSLASLPPSLQVQDTWLSFSAARANLTWDGVSALVVELSYTRGGLQEFTGGVEMLKTSYPASGCMYSYSTIFKLTYHKSIEI